MITSKEVNFVSAVIYAAARSAEEIKSFMCAVNAVLDENFQNYEIICVNDSAPDSVIHAIREFKDEHKVPALSIVSMAEGKTPQGLEKSMVAGVDASIGDYVFEFD